MSRVRIRGTVLIWNYIIRLFRSRGKAPAFAEAFPLKRKSYNGDYRIFSSAHPPFTPSTLVQIRFSSSNLNLIVRLDQTVSAVFTTIHYVYIFRVRIDEHIEIMMHQVHLHDGFLHIHRLHRKALGFHQRELVLIN